MLTTPHALKTASALVLILLLAACAPAYQGPSAPIILGPSLPPGSEPAYPPPKPQTGASPYPDEDKPPASIIQPVASRPQVAPGAVDSLLDNAWGAYRDTRYDTAVAFAERAQRIDSRRPEIYLVLGSCYLAKGQAMQARQMALKGIALSTANSIIRGKLERLLDRSELE